MDNDLLEYLRKTMMSGMGIPSSMLNYADELEFARSVSMQNGMFLRAVIVKQKKLTGPFSSFYQDLYENEFGTSTIPLFDKKELIKKHTKEKENNEKLSNNDGIGRSNRNNKNENEEQTVDIQSIKVQFPSPSALNSTNIADQINTANSIVQAITEGMFDANDNNTDQQHKFKFTKELNKVYMPNVDWEKIENIYEQTKTEAVEDNITAQLKSQGSGENSEM